MNPNGGHPFRVGRPLGARIQTRHLALSPDQSKAIEDIYSSGGNEERLYTEHDADMKAKLKEYCAGQGLFMNDRPLES